MFTDISSSVLVISFRITIFLYSTCVFSYCLELPNGSFSNNLLLPCYD